MPRLVVAAAPDRRPPVPEPARFREIPAGAVVVDLRARPPADIPAFARELLGAPRTRDVPVVVVCADGVASSGVAERLVALGVTRAGWLDGGSAA